MGLFIDRFEGEWAVIVWGDRTFNLPAAMLPPGASEGDALKLSVELDKEATKELRRRILRLEDDLFR